MVIPFISSGFGDLDRDGRRLWPAALLWILPISICMGEREPELVLLFLRILTLWLTPIGACLPLPFDV